VSGEDRKRDYAAAGSSPEAVTRGSGFLGAQSCRWKHTRTFFALGLVVLLVMNFSTALPPNGRAAWPGATSGLKVGVTPPTPPPSFGCESYGSSILVISPSPAAGAAGTRVTLEGSGYYNQVVKGSFTIWMANYSGGSLLSLASIPAPAPEPYWLNVTVPGTDAGVPLPPGPYEFWSLNESKTDPGCANFPFTLTATNQTAPPATTTSASGFTTLDFELIVLVVVVALIVILVIIARRRREETPQSPMPPSEPSKEGPRRPS
jgi:hypothetical protein